MKAKAKGGERRKAAGTGLHEAEATTAADEDATTAADEDATTVEDDAPAAAPSGARLDACPGCGARVPDSGATPNPEVNASPGCWAAYGDVLARQYGEWGNPPIHRLTVDTYAAQHPGKPSRKSTQSVALHLIGLYLALERGTEPRRISQETGRMVADPSAFQWLEPPPPAGQLTIMDVVGAATLKEHSARVRRWALSVWEAWADHHDTIRRWAGG